MVRSMKTGKLIFGLGSLLWGTLACEGQLSVPEPLPVADAGFDQVRYLGDASELTIDLDGRASCDPMGSTLQKATWSVVSAPGEEPSLEGEELGASFTVTEAGEYILTLQVSSGDRLSDPDYIAIQVKAGTGDDVVVAPPKTTACGDPIDS